MGTTAKEGNDMVDLTNNRSKTNANNVCTVTSTIDNDSDVEIVNDPVDLEEGIPIPETTYMKRGLRDKSIENGTKLREICSDGLCSC